VIEALKIGRAWTESAAVACGYRGCTPETCTSKRAELDLSKIDAALTTLETTHAPE
jgi:hypothetical protein